MQLEGGIYVVPVLINNAITSDFIIDSGASDVSISADVVMPLMRRYSERIRLNELAAPSGTASSGCRQAL